MKNFTDQWFALIENFSPAVQLILLILSGLVFLFLFLMRFRKFREKFFNLLNISFDKKILSHDLFFQKRYYGNIIKKADFKCQVKTFAFKTILEEMKDTVIDSFKDYFKRINVRNLSNPQLFDTFNDVLSLTKETYETQILKKLWSKYGEGAGRELYTYIYLQNFNSVHEERIDDVIKKIKALTNSSYLSNTDKVIIFLTLVMLAVDSAVIDIEEVFEDFNGLPAEIVKRYSKAPSKNELKS